MTTQTPMQMQIDANGWLDGARHIPSQNCAPRQCDDPTLVVLHAISLPPNEFGGPGIEALFTNTLSANAHPYFAEIAALHVSAHFVIDRAGRVTQYVSCEEVAWHAGVSMWCGVEKCNEFSIGIELEGCDDLPFTAHQYAALGGLLDALHARYPGLRDAVGHNDVAPGRKTDPGSHFDWAIVPPRWQQWRTKTMG